MFYQLSTQNVGIWDGDADGDDENVINEGLMASYRTCWCWCWWWYLTTLAVLQLLAVRTWPRFFSIITPSRQNNSQIYIFFREPFCSKYFFFTFSACSLFSENIGSSWQNGKRKACSQESGLQGFNFRNKRPKLTSLCTSLWIPYCWYHFTEYHGKRPKVLCIWYGWYHPTKIPSLAES